MKTGYGFWESGPAEGPMWPVTRTISVVIQHSAMLSSYSISLLLGNFARNFSSRACPMSAILKFCFCFINHLRKSSRFLLNGLTLINRFWLDINIIACVISFISFTGSILSDELCNFRILKFQTASNDNSSLTNDPQRLRFFVVFLMFHKVFAKYFEVC